MRNMYEDIHQRIHRIRIKFLQHFTLRGLQERLRIECVRSSNSLNTFAAKNKINLTLRRCYVLLV